MTRTSNRPVAAKRVSGPAAIIFGVSLNVVSMVVLLLWVNWLAAALTMGATLFYVFIYTMWLKRTTPQNIVIGATGTVKGDIEFGNNLRTENGADIDGYIKKTNSSKSKLTGDFLFKKKEKKESSETEERPDVVNKEAIA